MIFVTVGAQMSFDRLVRTVDQWAARSGRTDVLAQIGPTHWRPGHIEWTRFMNPEEFRKQIKASQAVVAHAGMGSIITALELGKPILVMPRRGDLKETRNDHQIATARYFAEQGRIAVAFDDQELMQKLDELDGLQAAGTIQSEASPQLISAIRAFIQGHEVSREPSRAGNNGGDAFGIA